MSNNDYIVEAVKGEPNSLTSIAFHTGVVLERERIIKLLDDECKISVPTDWHPNHCTCQAFIALIKGENK